MSRWLRPLPLLLASVLAIAALPLPGTPDFPLFLRWVDKLDASGLVEGYRYAVGPYPPLAFVILAGVTPLAGVLGVDAHLALKLIVLAALMLTAVIAWAWTRDLVVTGWLALGLVLNGPALGYLDVLFLPTLLLSLWALQRGRLALASLLFAVTCLIKWQPAVLAPLLLVVALAPGATAGRARRAAAVLLPALAAGGAALLAFGPAVLDRLRLAMADPFLSGQAFNASWVATHLMRALRPQWFGGLEDGLCLLITTHDATVLLIPKLVFAAVELAVLVAAWRRARSFTDILLYALLAYLAAFLFNAGVHENHLVIGQVLAVLLWAFDRRWLLTALFWTVASNLNLLLFYGVHGTIIDRARVVGGLDLGLLAALLNLVAFAVLVLRARGARPSAPARS